MDIKAVKTIQDNNVYRIDSTYKEIPYVASITGSTLQITDCVHLPLQV